MEPQELPASPLPSSTTFRPTESSRTPSHFENGRAQAHPGIGGSRNDTTCHTERSKRPTTTRTTIGSQSVKPLPESLRRRDLCSSSLHRRKAWTKSCRGRFAPPAIRNTPRLQGTRQCRNVGWSCPPTCPTPGPGGLHSRRQEARVFQVRDSRTQLSHHRHRRKLLGSMHSRE